MLEEWERLIPELRASSFDAIAASMSITEKRRQLVSFTDRYYSNVVRFVARKGSGFDPANPAGKTIGASRATFCQPVAQGFAVIALVCDEFGGGRHGFDTALGDLAIMDVSWCQEQDEGPAFRIADSVELGVAAPPLVRPMPWAKAPLFRRRRSDEP